MDALQEVWQSGSWHLSSCNVSFEVITMTLSVTEFWSLCLTNNHSMIAANFELPGVVYPRASKRTVA
jgi:hypothetical protein